jgi:hypothetical protein
MEAGVSRSYSGDMVTQRKQRATAHRESAVRRRFGSEGDVEEMTGIARRTLQDDRLRGHNKFPWYKVGRKVLYDLDEVASIIKASAGGRAA